MITQISGTLVAIVDGAAHVQAGDLVYEVLVPAADSMALAASLGKVVRFHTLHYLEGQGQGSSFWPRLVGFQTTDDRDFFELFTTVKGIGNRKALRALQMPFGRIAEAIAARDHALLQTLPEIGKRTAETICVELKGKIDRFVPGVGRGLGVRVGGSTAATRAGAVESKPAGAARAPRGATGAAGDAPPAATAAPELSPNAQLILMANSAVEVLVQLGHARAAARELVERVLMQSDPAPTTAEAIVTAALA